MKIPGPFHISVAPEILARNTTDLLKLPPPSIASNLNLYWFEFMDAPNILAGISLAP